MGLNPTRTGILAWLRRAGAVVDLLQVIEDTGERQGSIRVRHGGNRALTVGPADVPGLIDELPVLAALATHGGELRVTGAGELRHKESDRISALADGLRALGGHVEEVADGFHVAGARPLRALGRRGRRHRLAMAFAIAASAPGRRAESQREGREPVSYPGFFDVAAALCIPGGSPRR